jgi:phosphoribosylanthranilate isomerase
MAMKRTRIKMCGITRVKDAQDAAKAGADAIGMILWAKSPRLIETKLAAEIMAGLPPLVSRVGVFVDANVSFVMQCARALKLDYVQLHGRESLDYVNAMREVRVIRAIRSEQLSDYASELPPNLVALLVDSGTGGTGIEQDWDRLDAQLKLLQPRVPVIVAGGLTPENVAGVVRKLRPFGVDVSSGIERELGMKDELKMREFVHAVTTADLE